MDIETVNRLLWQHDLMGTGCTQAPEAINEYWTRADGIVQRLADGESFECAVVAEFDEAFWEDCLANSPRKERLDALLASARQLQPPSAQ